MKVFIVLIVVCTLACGSRNRLSPPRLEGKITGGETIEITDAPYHVSLEYYDEHRCSASIINERFALTTGHCMDGTMQQFLKVRAGSSIRGEGGTLHQAQRVFIHESFSQLDFDYDFGGVIVETPFIFVPSVQAIKYANVEPQAGVQGVVSGWGITSPIGLITSQLHSIQIPIVSRQECLKRYGRGITDNMICAGVLDFGDKDACLGDAGGPLVSDGVLVGMVSWGLSCGVFDRPAIYSNVAAAREWIDFVSSI